MKSPNLWVWRVCTRLAERQGQACRVLARGALNNCLVEFADGYRVVTSRWYVKKLGARAFNASSRRTPLRASPSRPV